MEKSMATRDELNNLSKDMVVFLYLQLAENFQVLTEQSRTIQRQNEKLIRQVEDLTEKAAILTQQRFGRKSEKNLIPGQMSLDLDAANVLNEAEALAENGIPEETPAEEVITYTRKKPGKRDVSLAGVETETIVHGIPEEELKKEFPNGWHELEDEVYKTLKYIPARFLVTEHHVKVYADKGHILRGKAPARLLNHSILTPELAAAVFSAKYVNAVPLNRLSDEFLRQDVNIPRQDMAGWMIRLNEYYLGPVRERMKRELLKSHHLHCDETPFVMPGHGKQYMWVYHSPGSGGTPPVYMYEYPGTRGASAPNEYLQGYKGILVTDGYESYHTLARWRPDDLKISGCWAHTKRKYADIIKSVKKGQPMTPLQGLAAEGVRRIDGIYHEDNKYKNASEEERLRNRKEAVTPLVDDYFAWVKSVLAKSGLDKSSALSSALNYSANQEQYLRVFLDDPKLPLDNNDAERSIKKFCVGKKNWQIIDSKNGAKASAFLYSLAETAKANGLKPYEYFAYLLYQLMEFPRGNVPEDTLDRMMPWSPELPESCKSTKTR